MAGSNEEGDCRGRLLFNFGGEFDGGLGRPASAVHDIRLNAQGVGVSLLGDAHEDLAAELASLLGARDTTLRREPAVWALGRAAAEGDAPLSNSDDGGKGRGLGARGLGRVLGSHGRSPVFFRFWFLLLFLYLSIWLLCFVSGSVFHHFSFSSLSII